MLSPLPFKITAISQGKPSEEHVFRCMGALSRFCSINREVINIAMINDDCQNDYHDHHRPIQQSQPGSPTGENDRTRPNQVFRPLPSSRPAAWSSSSSSTRSPHILFKSLININVFICSTVHAKKTPEIHIPG